MKQIPNWINNEEVKPISGEWFAKFAPHSGQMTAEVARSRSEDIDQAVQSACRAFPVWSSVTPVARGEILRRIASGLETHQEDLAQIISLETGKSLKDAKAEIKAAVHQGHFMAGEGYRMHGRTTTSGTPLKQNIIIRQPVGICGLVISANTPVANIAWKVFPALVCGNSAVLKASEDAPETALFFAKIAKESGLPPGVLNVIHGLGHEAGEALIQDVRIQLVSFTGSTSVGRRIAEICGKRLVKISLELGGKNPFVVCDDADLEKAVSWAALSAFSNSGQRCASASRILVFKEVYDSFKALFIEKVSSLKLGISDEDALGPVINERQLQNMVKEVQEAAQRGACILIGGSRMTDENHNSGYYMQPTVLESLGPDDHLSMTEIFGPVTCLYRVKDFEEAVQMANHSPYGLTACIHTRNLNRAMEFARRVESGVVNVNAGSHGSEPHLPFGGVKNSGNGTREPGQEALDVYSQLKNIGITVNTEET